MEEKTYNLMGNTGTFNMVLGICSIIIGISVGVLLIVSGANLLTDRKKLTF